MEHGVTEAADVQDVVSLRCLARSVGQDVDADKLRIGDNNSQSIPMISRHCGYFTQAQNRFPACLPFAAFRCTIAVSHFGHVGAEESSGGGVTEGVVWPFSSARFGTSVPISFLTSAIEYVRAAGTCRMGRPAAVNASSMNASRS